MSLLGAIYCGGASQRFGSDKAQALYNGRRLVDLALDRLRPLCATTVLLGPDRGADAPVLADWPAPGLGPAGGLAAALRHAAETGHDAVLSVPVDMPLLRQAHLRALVQSAHMPAIACSSEAGRLTPVVGYWPVHCLEPVRAALMNRPAHDRGPSLHALARAAGARPVALPAACLRGINTPEELAALERIPSA